MSLLEGVVGVRAPMAIRSLGLSHLYFVAVPAIAYSRIRSLQLAFI